MGRTRTITRTIPMRRSKRPEQVPRQAVLVVMLPDGGVEAYAERHVDVHFINRLDAGREDGDLANMVDAYLESTLPRPFKELYWPNKLRGTGVHERVTPERAADALFKTSILRGLREFRKEVANGR